MTTPITKEQELRAFITGFLTDPAHDEHSENSMTAQVFRIALAAMDAEPVASCIVEDGCMCSDGFGEYAGHSLRDGSHVLYAAPPAPVVPEEINDIIKRFQYQANHLSDWHHIDEHSCKVNRRDLMTALEFMNACRASMLETDRK